MALIMHGANQVKKPPDACADTVCSGVTRGQLEVPLGVGSGLPVEAS